MSRRQPIPQPVYRSHRSMIPTATQQRNDSPPGLASQPDQHHLTKGSTKGITRDITRDITWHNEEHTGADRVKRLVLGTAILLLALAYQTTQAANDPLPNTTMGPAEVVKVVVNALKTNNPAQNDDGIETVFAFASPGNKSATGPLPRFKQMLKTGYGNMLNHRSSEFSPIEIQGNQAWQAVWLALPNGDEAGYMFQMGKQQSGDYQGMWMTEGVFPLPARGQSI